MMTTIKQGKDEDKAEGAIVFGKKSKKSPKLKINQEVDRSILGTRDNNNNIAVKQQDDSDLNSRTSTGKKNKKETAQKQNNYYESSLTQASAINDLMNDDNRPHGCDFCEKRFKRANHLVGHVRIHTGERPYPCIYCPKTFRTMSVRNRHEQRHRGDRQYKCQKCDATFVVKAALSKHCQRRHPESTPYVCTYTNCEKKYGSMELLIWHIKQGHGVKNHKCPTCSVAFSYPSALQMHFKTKKHLILSQQLNSESIPPEEEDVEIREIFKCMTCSNVYKTRERLRRHKRRREHWSAKRSSSNITAEDNNSSQEQENRVQDEKFPVSSLQVKIRKENVKEGTDCNNNNNAFEEHDTTTRRHTQFEPDLNLVKTEEDSKVKEKIDESVLGTRNGNSNIVLTQEQEDPDLTSRTPTVKGKDESVQKQNNYYESSHTQASAITYVMENIEENRPFGCDFCEKRFKRLQTLKSHVRIHTGERPYLCMYCPKTFRALNARSNHEQFHRGDRQYECQKCYAKFVIKVDLAKHCLRRHPVSTDYVCKYPNCEKKFSRRNFLTGHIKWEHGVKNHKCLTCSVAFSYPSALQIHLKSKRHLRLSQQQQQQQQQRRQNSEPIPLEEEESVRKNFKCTTCSNVYKSRKRLMKHKGRRRHWSAKRSSNNIAAEDNNSNKEEESRVEDENCHPSTLQDKKKKEKVKEGTDCSNNNEHDSAAGHNTQLEPDLSLKENARRPFMFFLCGVCLKTFKTSQHLENHQIHRQHAPHECPVCLQNFHTVHLLRKHLLTHKSF